MFPYILIVVLYKEKIENSDTITSFVKKCTSFHNKIKLIIWDNSPNSINKDKSYLDKHNIEYVYYHTPENRPLSNIYNNIFETYKNCDITFLFDQDSIISEEYFQKTIEAHLQNDDIALSIPFVKHNETIVSPGKFQFYRGHYIRHLTFGRIRSKNIIAITSGMAIKNRILKETGLNFDENLSLYGIDTKFCLDYSKYFDNIYIIQYQLEHSLSQFNKEDKKVKIYRYKSQMKAMRYITKQRSILSYLLCSLATFIHYTTLRIKHL
jgi:GT2 family glycosyltransferase